MGLNLFIVAVFRLVNEPLGKLIEEYGRLRARGPKPALDDGEVRTMEIVGEFLGLDADEAIREYFAHSLHPSEFISSHSGVCSKSRLAKQCISRKDGLYEAPAKSRFTEVPAHPARELHERRNRTRQGNVFAAEDDYGSLQFWDIVHRYHA